MKRLFDICLALLLLTFVAILMLIIGLAVKLTSKGPVLHWSDRVGRRKEIFKMAKVRTMKMETPQLATHLMTDFSSYMTPVGGFLRRTSLDEIPQIWNILRGDMSFVGPRPALYNQDDLVALREKEGVNDLVPGLTGWAQVNGRDDLPIAEKVKIEAEYLGRRSFVFDLLILFLTLKNVVTKKGVSH